MIAGRESFGACVRRERESRRLGLRQMAKKIGVSPTYLSKVERDEFKPPTEDKVRAIARLIERDSDELLAMAGRVSSDVADIIRRHPVELSAWLRLSKDWSAEDVAWTTQMLVAVITLMNDRGMPDKFRERQWSLKDVDRTWQMAAAVARVMGEEGTSDASRDWPGQDDSSTSQAQIKDE